MDTWQFIVYYVSALIAMDILLRALPMANKTMQWNEASLQRVNTELLGHMPQNC
jgi:hypothetical protein